MVAEADFAKGHLKPNRVAGTHRVTLDDGPDGCVVRLWEYESNVGDDTYTMDIENAVATLSMIENKVEEFWRIEVRVRGKAKWLSGGHGNSENLGDGECFVRGHAGNCSVGHVACKGGIISGRECQQWFASVL